MASKVNTQNINKQINKAIATTVVVTTIGITSTINSFPIKAANHQSGRRGPQEMEHVVNLNQNQDLEEDFIEVDELVQQLLKQGNYKEAREIKKSFGIKNNLALELRNLNFYAVHTV